VAPDRKQRRQRDGGGGQSLPLRTLAHWIDRLAPALVVLVAFFRFVGALGNGLTYDEGLVIERADPFLRSGAVGRLFSRAYFEASLEDTWRPLVTATYMLDRSLSSAPTILRLHSIAWHALAGVLVLALARRVLSADLRAWALVAALCFVLHPTTTEVVDNASFREDAIVTALGLGAILLGLRGRLVTMSACYAGALLAKESALVLPALFVLVAWTRRAPPRGLTQRTDPTEGAD
jgi:hypothetical protein